MTNSFTGSIAIRGIRSSIPSGYVLGRTQPGQGAPHLIAIKDLASSSGGGGGGATALSGLSDVNVTEGAGINGYTLNWDNTTGKWVATAPVSGGSSSVAVPTVVQSTHNSSSTYTSCTVTFPAATTVGNSVLLLVGGTTGTWACSAPALEQGDFGTSHANEQVAYFLVPVTTASTTYTISGNNNGGMWVMAIEFSGAIGDLKWLSGQAVQSGATASFGYYAPAGYLKYIILHNDNTTGTETAISPATGLTLLFGATTESYNHHTYFYQADDTVSGNLVTATFTTNPSYASIVGMLSLRS